jgi:hypothetical protein
MCRCGACFIRCQGEFEAGGELLLAEVLEEWDVMHPTLYSNL